MMIHRVFIVVILRLTYLVSVLIILLAFTGCKEYGNSTKTSHYAAIDSAYETCSIFIDSNLTDLVAPYLDSLYSAHGLRSTPDLLRKYHFIANMHVFATKNDLEAEKYLDSSASLLKDNPKNKQALLRYYFLKGNYHIEKNEYEFALKALFKGKSIVESLNTPCEGGGFTNALGYLLYKQERYTEALHYFQERAFLNNTCKSDDELQYLFNVQQDNNEMGLCFEKLGQYDSALYHYNRGIDLIINFRAANKSTPLHFNKSLGVLLGNKGSAFAQMEQYDSAKYYLNQSIDINLQPDGAWGDALFCKIKLAHVHLQLNQADSAAILIAEITEKSKEQPEIAISQRLAALQQAYYMHIGAYQDALQFTELKQQLLDSMRFQGPNKFGQPDFRASFKALEQEINLITLQNNATQKNNLIAFALIGLIGSLAFGMVLLKKRKTEKAYTVELEALHQNAQVTNFQLLQGLEALEQSHEENARLMRVLVHDLRSPMAGILSAIRLLQEENMSKPEQDELLQLIEKSADNGLQFIKDILHISTTDKDSDYTYQDISEVLKSCLQLAELEATKKGLSLHMQLISMNLPVHQQKIWRVFNNLLNNAIKFSKPGDSIFIEMQEQPDSLLVTVRDNGIGIATDQQKNLFNGISSMGKSGTQGEKSYGMGLAISKQIIAAHQGEIWVESEIGKGSTFYIQLPKHRKN